MKVVVELLFGFLEWGRDMIVEEEEDDGIGLNFIELLV
jgi:hypothetical protein